MFNLQKKKELKKQRELEFKKQKEIELKIKVKTTINSLKKQVSQFETMKNDFINKAKNAKVNNNSLVYKQSVLGLKRSLSLQRFSETMISTIENSIQINDMNKIIGSFIEGVNSLSKEMTQVTPSVDMVEALKNYEESISKNAQQYEALNTFLDTATSSIENLDVDSSNISDEEIEKMINNKIINDNNDIDNEINQRINALDQKLKDVY